MGFRIAPRPIPQKAKPVRNKSYTAFVKTLPCAVTGQYGVDPAHLSTASTQYGHMGRGKQQRASDRWQLPLVRFKHDEQGAMGNSGPGELGFWIAAGINPYVLALTLYGLWEEMGPEAFSPCCEVIERARLGHDLRTIRT